MNSFSRRSYQDFIASWTLRASHALQFPLLQIDIGGEIFLCVRLWHYILYGFFEYFTLYYSEPLF